MSFSGRRIFHFVVGGPVVAAATLVVTVGDATVNDVDFLGAFRGLDAAAAGVFDVDAVEGVVVVVVAADPDVVGDVIAAVVVVIALLLFVGGVHVKIPLT